MEKYIAYLNAQLDEAESDYHTEMAEIHYAMENYDSSAEMEEDNALVNLLQSVQVLICDAQARNLPMEIITEIFTDYRYLID